MGLAKVRDAFTETAIDDEIVVMSLADGDFFSLTGTARAIWLRLDDGLDRDGLVAALAADYDAAPEAIAADVDPFLDRLRAIGLLAAG